MNKKILALVGLAVTSVSSSAHALPFIGVGVVGGPNFNISSQPAASASDVSGGVGYSAGLAAELGPIAAMALYTHTSSTNALTDRTTTANSLQIPVHFTLGVLGAHVGFGGYYATSLEDAGGSDYGVSAGAKVSIPVVGINVRGLVNYGLKDQDGGKNALAALMLGWDFL